MENPPGHFTIKTLAEYWDCSEGFIRARIADNSLECLKMGTMFRITKEAVKQYEERCKCQETADLSPISNSDASKANATTISSAPKTDVQNAFQKAQLSSQNRTASSPNNYSKPNDRGNNI